MIQHSAAVAGTIQIGEAAKLTALSIDAIRLYERRAVSERSPNFLPSKFPAKTAERNLTSCKVQVKQ